jgi:hypothetical protein
MLNQGTSTHVTARILPITPSGMIGRYFNGSDTMSANAYPNKPMAHAVKLCVTIFEPPITVLFAVAIRVASWISKLGAE